MVLETILSFMWELIKLWGSLFIAPIKNLNMLWVLIPIYLTWFFAEFFQEKQGTSMGNAVTNAVVVFWGGFDWIRTTVTKISAGKLVFGWISISRVILAACLIMYGLFLVILGVKGNKLIKYIGRIREVTYLIVVFTPVFYEVIPLNWKLILAVIIFFPIFYFAIELLDKYMPNPAAVKVDLESKGGGFGSSDSGDSFGKGADEFGGSTDSKASDDLSSDKGFDDLKL